MAKLKPPTKPGLYALNYEDKPYMAAIKGRNELFKKYKIRYYHSKWESYDNWVSVEIFRIMHEGNLPNRDNKEVLYILDFLDKYNNDEDFVLELKERNDFKFLLVTARRMVYRFVIEILKALKDEY